ncbi:MAG: acyltransferase family protein [Solirubrobacterales bacterium]|nr:acyltransferase family protein [Solirubrobacterales bacterium]
MPEPVERRSGQRYMPGLDGLRAIAVMAVIAYHLKVGFAPGGLLGVGVFFTLSGYLITDILLEGWVTRKLSLKNFWLARARRLLPALFVMLAVVLLWVWIGDPELLSTLRGETLASIFFTENWWAIAQDMSYFDRFGAPSPMSHLWSLAVEEQFYIIWPWLLLLLLRISPAKDHGKRARRERIRPNLALITLGLAVVSGILMAVLYKPGFDTTRVYEGTDTRAFALLFGAAVAMVWPSRRLDRNLPAKARRNMDLLGVGGLLVIFILIWQTSEFSPFLYRGGMVILAIATSLVVAVLAHPATRLGPIVGCRPLRWIGVRSYAIYLWQLPIITLTTPSDAHGFSLVRSVLQVGATFLVAALSWKFIEDPIRKGAIGRLWKRFRAGEFTWKRFGPEGKGLTVAGAGVFLVLLMAMVGVAPSSPIAPIAATGGEGEAAVKEIATAAPVAKTVISPEERDKFPKSLCDSVAYIGDSTSVGLYGPEADSYLPDKNDQLDARLADVGVSEQHIDISGARSSVEEVNGQPNAVEAAQAIADTGFKGCWIFAMGTNDTANVAVGSTIGMRERIDRLMGVAGDSPVLWINVRTLNPGNPAYSEENMQSWDDELLDACQTYPNMRIYDWANRVQDEWFIEDGIHFTSDGYKVRARAIANALPKAFGIWPSFWAKTGCLVE